MQPSHRQDNSSMATMSSFGNAIGASRDSQASLSKQGKFLQACRGGVSHSTVAPGIKSYRGDIRRLTGQECAMNFASAVTEGRISVVDIIPSRAMGESWESGWRDRLDRLQDPAGEEDYGGGDFCSLE